MGELSIQRWRRFGHDRWYVNGADGASLGWADARTGEVHVDDPADEQAVRGALREVLPGGEAPESVPPPAGLPASPPPQPAEPWAVTVRHRDLGGREAGSAVQEQATAARQAAPIATTLARVFGAHTEERAWRVGAQGERKVATQLAKLPDGWHVLHAIPVGNRGSDIDHLVIGPAGVFTINAKHHPNGNVWVAGNTFMVNGRKVPYVRNARHEATRAGKLLSAAAGRKVDVRGVIAVVGAANGFTVKEQPTDVGVVPRKRLVRWLASHPAWLTNDQVRELHRLARRSDTWQPPGR